MRRLDNSGWGLSTMITFLVVLVLFIVVIAFLIYRVDNDKNSNVNLLEEEFIYFE